MVIELFILSSIGRCRTVDKTVYIFIQYLVYRSRLISRKKSLRDELSVPPNQPVRVFVFMLRRGLRLPVALAIALAIALLSELPAEFPIHLRIEFGCLVEALWMFFSCLVGTCWKPFGTFWTPLATLFGPRDDSWPISGPGWNKLRKSYNLVAIWLPPGSPI